MNIIEEYNVGHRDFRGVDLWGANLQGADLRGADLRGADLWCANLQGANLRGADLRDADLRDADLRGAKLRDVNLRGANLRGADLRYVNLRGANLRGADLRYVNLYDTIGDGQRIKTLKTELYTVNVYDDRMQIGCKNYSQQEWRNFTEEEIDAMDDNALEWWREHKDWIFKMIEVSV